MSRARWSVPSNQRGLITQLYLSSKSRFCGAGSVVCQNSVEPAFEVATAAPAGVATMEKTFEGEIAGRSATLFTASYDQAAVIFDKMSLTPEYPEFLTLPLYEAMA